MKNYKERLIRKIQKIVKFRKFIIYIKYLFIIPDHIFNYYDSLAKFVNSHI